MRTMELNQNEGVAAQPAPVNSEISDDKTYTFAFPNNEQEEIDTIAKNVLQRYPNCMLTRMVNSHKGDKEDSQWGIYRQRSKFRNG